MMRAVDCETPASFNTGSAMTPKISIDTEDVELLKESQQLNDYAPRGKIGDIESSTTKSDSELITSDENETNENKKGKFGKVIRRKTLALIATLLLATGTIVGIALHQDTVQNLFAPSTVTTQELLKPPKHDGAINSVIPSSKSTVQLLPPLDGKIDTNIPASNSTAELLPSLNGDIGSVIAISKYTTRLPSIPTLSLATPPKANSQESATLVPFMVSPKSEKKDVDMLDFGEW